MNRVLSNTNYSRGDFQKKKQRNEQLHNSMYKQLIGVKNVPITGNQVSELGKTTLKVGIESKLFKYLQTSSFIETNRYLSKPFKEKELDKKDWVQNLNSMLDRLSLCNLMQNIFKVANRVIPTEDYTEDFQETINTFIFANSFINSIENKEKNV